MATFPVVNHISNAARTEGEVKADLEAMLSATKQIPGAAQAESAVTIAGGAITPAGGVGVLVVDTEAAAATDDLANIVQTNYPDGACLLLRNSNAARFVVLKHAATGAGQIFLQRGVDYALDDTNAWVMLVRRGTSWYEVFRSPHRLSMPVVHRTASFTVTPSDSGKTFTMFGSLVVSFPPASTLGNGWTAVFINTDTGNSSTLDASGSELIDGVQTVLLHAFITKIVVCDGTRFFTLPGYTKPRRVTIPYSSTLVINRNDAEYFEVAPLTGNVSSFIINNGSIEGERVRIRFVQDATGGRTVALPAGAKVAGSLASVAGQASVMDLTYSFSGNRLEGFWTQIPL